MSDSQEMRRSLTGSFLTTSTGSMLKANQLKSPLKFSNNAIELVAAQIQQQKELLQLLQQAVPQKLSPHIQHSLISDNKLLIYTESAVWAAQLRFYSQAILSAVEPMTGNLIKSMQVKLLIDQFDKGTNVTVKPNAPSLATSEALRAFCLNQSTNELTIALLKLTHTLQKVR